MSRRVHPDHTFSADPHEARERRIAEAALTVRGAMMAAGAHSSVVAAHLGVSESEFKRLLTPSQSGRMIPLADAAGLPPAVLRIVADWMVEPLGCAVVELPPASEDALDLRTLAAATRETADVVASAIDAAARGHMTRAEGAALERECDEALGVLLSIRERARQAQREGVIGLGGRKCDA